MYLVYVELCPCIEEPGFVCWNSRFSVVRRNLWLILDCRQVQSCNEDPRTWNGSHLSGADI